MPTTKELAAAQAAGAILEILGPLSPRDDGSIEKLRNRRARCHRANESLFERRGAQPPSEQSDNPYQRPGLRMAAKGA